MEDLCCICACEMGAAKYVAPDETAMDHIVEGTDCIRIKCGHAFHAACILQGFREVTTCPECRAPLRAAAPSVVASAQIGNGGQHFVLDLTTMQITADESEADSDTVENPTANVVRIALQHERSTSIVVRDARSSLKRAISDYKALRNVLVAERATRLRAALASFRRDFRSKHLKAARLVGSHLERVEELEKSALLKSGISEADTSSFFSSAFSEEYDLRSLLAFSQNDPTTRRFWAK